MHTTIFILFLVFGLSLATKKFPKHPHDVEIAKDTHSSIPTRYVWSVLPPNTSLEKMCNNSTCRDGRKHTICLPPKKAKHCKNFKHLEMGFVNERLFVMSHNGLRNRIAKASGWFATNMNYLVRLKVLKTEASNTVFQHWDENLASMAEKWVHQCRFDNDSCDYIYSVTYALGQNWIYEKRPPGEKWPHRIVSLWYTESNLLNHINDVDNVTETIASNFTQLAWAKSQFIGCAGALMFRGYLATCYYYPKGNIIGEPAFIRGKGEDDVCTQCEANRRMCSDILTGLCGMDDKYVNVGVTLKISTTFLMIIIARLYLTS